MSVELIITDKDGKAERLKLLSVHLDVLLSKVHEVVMMHRETPGALVEDHLSIALWELDELAVTFGIIK